MASSTDIAEVRESLPPEAAGLGWDDARIADVLDSGSSPVKTILKFWRFRAGQTASYVDVSESGSSRQLSSINKQAMEMLKYWEDRAKAEDDAAVDPNAARGRISFHSAKRV